MQQKELAKLLDVSPAMVSRLAKRGMPTDSLERAQRWRKRHLEPGRIKGNRHNPAGETDTALNQRQLSHPQPSFALPHALALLGIASTALKAGQDIAAMVPALRAAMHAVPEHERDPAMLLPSEVMDVLTADVAAVVAEFENDDQGPATDEPMTNDEADEMGRFWYRVAAGEIRPA